MLDSFLRQNCARKFRYGSWDCCLFVADAIEAMTGVDLAAPFRGTYEDRAGASRAMKYCGAADVAVLVGKVASEHDMPVVLAPQAQRGDMVLVRRGKRSYSLGIMGLRGRDVVIPFAEGLRLIHLSNVVRAWRV